MTIKEFCVQIPFLCDAKNAERHSRKNFLVFEDELKADGGAFKRTEDDEKDPFNRMEIMFGFHGDQGKIDQCKRLLRIAELSHYSTEHNLPKTVELDELVNEAVMFESDYPEIAKALTVDQALKTTAWNI